MQRVIDVLADCAHRKPEEHRERPAALLHILVFVEIRRQAVAQVVERQRLDEGMQRLLRAAGLHVLPKQDGEQRPEVVAAAVQAAIEGNRDWQAYETRQLLPKQPVRPGYRSVQALD